MREEAGWSGSAGPGSSTSSTAEMFLLQKV